MNSQNNTSNTVDNQGNDLSLPSVDAAQPQTQPQPQPQPQQSPATDKAATAPATTLQDETGETVPLIADDADLIEKAWVEKAKQLVEQTKDDPYNQNKEINKFKAVYIKKRYNKDIKLSKD